MKKTDHTSVVTYPEIGDVYYKKSPRGRYIRISINQKKMIKVSVPRWVSLKAAESFLLSKKNWVLKHKNSRTKDLKAPQIYTSENDCFSRLHKFKFVFNGVEEPGYKIIQDTVLVYIPESIPVTSNNVQNTIKMALIETWRKEAKQIVIPRTLHLANIHGFTINKIAIKNTTTRWGSCSHKNNINLSLQLIKLPGHLMDYVILHELVHTKIKNHQPQFWKALDELTGNSKELKKQMKAYSLTDW